MSFSAVEQKTGSKWINGKDIYKKTVTYTSSATIGDYTKQTDIKILTGVSDMDACIDLKAFVSSASLARHLPFLSLSGSAEIVGACAVMDYPNITLRIIRDTWGTQYTWYFTLWYTKK